MKVLHFYKTYMPNTVGGIERVIFEIAEGTVEHGVQTDVLSIGADNGSLPTTLERHNVHYCEPSFEIASTPFSFSAYKKFKALAQKSDIIHYHFPYPFADFLHLLCRVKKPSLVTYHSDVVNQKKLLMLYRPLRALFLKNIDHIVATSPNYLASSEVLQKYLGKTSIVPLGLSDESLPKAPENLIKKWSRKFGNDFFLFVGCLRYYKGLRSLIAAAKGVPFNVVIVGDGPNANDLQILAKNMGCSNIHFVGAVEDDDKAALLSLCRAFVFPSNLRSEAFGVALLEAAFFGKPLISCEIGTGTTFVNIDNETGVVVRPNDPAELKAAMLDLWNDEKKAKQFGIGAKMRFEKLFTSKEMCNSYLNIYQSLLK